MHVIYFRLSGTPPFTVTWSKDGRELPDNDYYRCIIYGDGGVALRLSEIRPQDAGEYTCVVRNDFGVASCNSLFAVQGLICFHISPFNIDIIFHPLPKALYLSMFGNRLQRRSQIGIAVYKNSSVSHRR